MSGIVILTIVFVLYALVASRLERLSITAPMVFVLAGVVLGRSVTDRLDISTHERARPAGRGADARAPVVRGCLYRPAPEVEDDARLPGRLLLIGLPLTIAFGTGVRARSCSPAAGWAAAALIASILAPTDAALGLAIFTNRAVPVRIRRALNVESGLNDGIATPFVTLFLTLLVSEEAGGGGHWVVEAGKEIGLALIVAVGVGVVGGALLRACSSTRFTSGVSEQLAIVSLALLAYLGAVASGGTGSSRRSSAASCSAPRRAGPLHRPTEFTETVGLVRLVLRLDGVRCDLRRSGPDHAASMRPAIAYAVLSLTVIRMVPVAISLLGLGLRRDTVALMGWFGPRGLASVVFTLVAVEALHRVGCRVRRDRRGRDVDDPPLGHSARPHGRPARPRLRTPDEGCRERARVDGRA